MKTSHTFNYKKATQAINFFASRMFGRKIDKLLVLKLIFYADRFHIRKYGRPVVNDTYWAMSLGPVPSGVKRIAELDLQGVPLVYAKQYLVLGSPRHVVKSTATVDDSVFSESDVEALTFAWNKFKSQRRSVINATHLYPEWYNHESELKSSKRVRMRYEDFLDDPQHHVDPCFRLSAEEKESRKEHLRELATIEALWK